MNCSVHAPCLPAERTEKCARCLYRTLPRAKLLMCEAKDQVQAMLFRVARTRQHVEVNRRKHGNH